MQKYIVYLASSLDEVYKCAYSILKYLDVYNLKPPPEHSLVIYTNFPELLEAYGSFFHQFQLRPIPEGANKDSILSNLKTEEGDAVLFMESNSYLLQKIETEKGMEYYKNLKEFGFLLRDFFGRYQEESVPNQVKLIHHIDAKKIEKEKSKFDSLPLAFKWYRKLSGRGWKISDYKVRI